MLKDVLEGCVLEITGRGETRGYEITKRLNTLGFADAVDGTVLVRLEKNKLVAINKRPSDSERVVTMAEFAIQAKDLRKSFKNTEVLKGVSFEVKSGEIFALLGSNGAGKTTIINMLATLMKAGGGAASVCGFDIVKQPDKVRESISLTGQFAAVDGILTGRENVTLIAKLRGVPNPEKSADNLLTRFGLENAADRRAATYSGGMMRRLDIAMSLVGTPAVIFLDEPTTGLDPEARLEVWKTVKELASGGVTIFLTTQYLEEAEKLADRIAILRSGRIIASGTPDELKKLFPPAKVEYIEKQPTLEEIFLAIIDKEEDLT